MRSQVFVLCVCVGLCVVECGNILAILPFIGKSHFFSYEPILAALARRGHDVTVVSKFPRTSPLKGYTDIDVRNPETTEVKINLTKIEIFGILGEEVMEKIEEFLIDFESVFKRDDFQRLLHGNVSFDLVITEVFVSDMFNGVAYKFNAPLVGIISSTVLPWANDRFGIPDNPSYIRSTFYPGVGEMTFYDRILNTFALMISKVFYDYYISSRDEVISKRYLGSDTPPVKDIVKNTSLLLTNSHFSLNQARPFPPNVIEISGAHLKQLKPLPQVD
uniref:UDP-glucuronosyltransferase n=1 Tax=Clastoptera arizonana TaxID=38151 RepID=A0A1B6CQJ1_9HEMI